MAMATADDRLTQEFPDIIRGDGYPIEIDFLDENESAMSVDGRILYVTLKYSPEQPDSDALLQVAFPLSGADATNGIVRKSLTARQTLSLPPTRLFIDYKLIDGEVSALTIAGGRVNCRSTSTWAVGPDETAPVLYLPTTVALEFARFGDGLAQDDPALIAVLDGLLAVDALEGVISPNTDLSGLADPIPAGTYSIPVTAADSAGNQSAGTFTLQVAEATTGSGIEILQTWSTTSFTVESA